MSDLRLRELERQHRVVGGPAAEAALLRERLRLGVLAWERVQVAAWAGHPLCVELVAARGEPPVTPLVCARLAHDLGERRRWARLARRLGKRTVIGAGAAGLAAALEVGAGRNEQRSCARELDLLERWQAGGDERVRTKLVAALEALRTMRLAAQRPSWRALVELLEGATGQRPVYVARAAVAVGVAVTIAGARADRVQQAVAAALARGALDLA